MTRPYKPKDIPGLLPYIIVKDIDNALTFYQQAFQFKLGSEPMRQGDKIMHAELKILDTQIMLAPEGAWGSVKQSPASSNTPSPIGLYVYVEDVVKFFEHAKAQGAEVINAPEIAFWGDKTCCLRDSEGYDWTFATNVADFDPSKLPSA
tara:strand:- start:10308 stop:10754 length:447 start_codon:yes stop_codon:yes gene_type:complete